MPSLHRPTSRLKTPFALLIAVLAVGAAWLGWKKHTDRREWQAMLPELPAEVGNDAPGLRAKLSACNTRLQNWPPDPAVLAEFTRLCHANGFLAEAITGYQALIKFEPKEPRWPHLLASVLAGYGRLDEALPLLRRTTALAPDNLLGWLRLGDGLLKSDAIPEAVTAYQAALQRAPGNAYALLGLARCELDQEHWTAARSRLQQAVASDPKFASAQSLLASVFDRLGNPAAAAVARSQVADGGHYTEPADDWKDELIPYCYTPYTLLLTAQTAVADGNPEKAEPILRRALTLAPSDARLHRQLGKVLFTLGDFAGARQEMQQAVTLSPTDETLRIDLVDLQRKTKNPDALPEAVAAGLAACPASAALRFEAGLLAASAGKSAEAEQHFQFAWENRPDNPAAARELANLFFHTDRNEEGVGVLQKILSGLPQATAVHLQLVQYGIEAGDPRTAVWLRQALDSGAPALPAVELQQGYQRRFGHSFQ